MNDYSMQNFRADSEHLSDADPVGGPPLLITPEMVSKSVSKMKLGKAASPSGVVAEMLKAAGEQCYTMLADLANSIIYNNRIPSDWENSFMINL